MKCEKCGASLSLNIKNCPYCGTPNEAARKHISDMNRYENKFKQTRWQVIQNSRWFSKYMALFLAIVLVVIANAVLIGLKSNGWGYSLKERKMKLYNQTHHEEVQKQIEELMEQGEYWKVYYLHVRYNRLYENNYRKWSFFYNAAYEQQKIYDAILYSMNENENNRYQRSKWISDISRALYNFYDAIKRRDYYGPIEEDVAVYLYDMRTQVEDFLYVYCRCSAEDIEKIASSDETQIVSILVRRLGDEE